ncbi:MAG: cytochrome P450 [Pirellulaceae bacterium]
MTSAPASKLSASASKLTASGLPDGPNGSWIPTLQLIRDARVAFTKWIDKYGDPFLVRALNGPVVVTGRPELIQQIFSHDAADYDPFAELALTPTLGSGSMLLLKGEAHRRERKLTMPMFHGERMRAYSDVMQRSALRAMELQPPNKPFEMLTTTTKISLEIIVEALFGGDEQQEVEQVLSCAREVIDRSRPLLFFSNKLHIPFFGLSPWDRFINARQRLRSLVEREIERRRESLGDRDDILSMLVAARYEDGTAITPEHLFDELGTFLFAGHETSAIALAWAFYHLHQNPSSLSSLRAGLAQFEDPTPEQLIGLPYLKAVVQESLRLNPIVTEVLRKLKAPMQLGPYLLPAGFAVAPATTLVHYNESIYPEPELFRPERFLERSYSSNEFMPFGGGHRRCAGAAFAMHEMMIVIGTIISKYEITLLEPDEVVTKRRNITMGPSTGIRVSCRPLRR